jgi:hypothetical protein
MNLFDTAMVRGDVMQTFTIGLGHSWWIQAVRRNPLVRRSDRIEFLVVMFAVLFTIAAIPAAGAIGTFVHDARMQIYAEEALTRHEVIATAVDVGVIVGQPTDVSFTARAKWSASGRRHTGVVRWSGRAEIGDQQAIWVNDAGEYVGAPSASSRAAGDAVAIATVVWFGVVGVAAGLVYVVRCSLNRWRYAQWDHQINAFRANDGRTNRQ